MEFKHIDKLYVSHWKRDIFNRYVVCSRKINITAFLLIQQKHYHKISAL